jgi:thioredoxin-related protein
MRLLLLSLASFLLFVPASIGQVKFGDDFAAAQKSAAKEKKLVLLYLADGESDDCRKSDADFQSNAKLAETLARKFVTCRRLADSKDNKAIFKRFDADKPPVFVVFDSDGRSLARLGGYQPPAKFSAWIDGMIELQTGLNLLEKADKSKPNVMVSALRKIGAVATDRSYTVLVEAADNEDLPESVRKVAIEGLGKQSFGPEKLLGFLTHRNGTLKSAATNTIKLQGQAAAGALVEGLANENPDQRVASWALLTALNRDPKLVRDVNFWRKGKAEDREKAVAALREWLKAKD